MIHLLIATAVGTFFETTTAVAQLAADSYEWHGQCLGANEPPRAVTLIITTNALAMTLSGKFNGQDLSAINYDRTRGIVMFDVKGDAPEGKGLHFSGTLKFNEAIEGILSNRSNASISKCTFGYVEVGRAGASE